MKKILLLGMMSVMGIVGVMAQGSAFVATHQHRAILPGDVKNVSFVDGDMYCYSSGVMLKVQRSGDVVIESPRITLP